MKILFNHFIIVALVIPSLAKAGGSETTFSDLDKDGDGKLSIVEAGAHEGLSIQFIKLDTDKNGYLTIGEVSAYKPDLTESIPGME
ncbi:MAG: hypothetical protein V3V31_16635 [Methylococcales bacterium]